MSHLALADVAAKTMDGDSFDLALANFLDAFYAAPTIRALLEAPPLLAPQCGELGRVQDAYLAAVAEELARQNGLRMPEWINADERKLHRPWFASSLSSLRAILLLESPPGFRVRNLFVSKNALSRV